jgi:hypothetical protein
MNSPFKFLRRVRIHGRECGAVARALRHEVKGLSLYQAELEKSSRSTIERKSMSTKTTFKRIALVAVASLGLGLFTAVAPATAGGDVTFSVDTTSQTIVANPAVQGNASGDSTTASQALAPFRICVSDADGARPLTGDETITASVVGVPTTVTAGKTLSANSRDLGFVELAYAANTGAGLVYASQGSTAGGASVRFTTVASAAQATAVVMTAGDVGTNRALDGVIGSRNPAVTDSSTAARKGITNCYLLGVHGFGDLAWGQGTYTVRLAINDINGFVTKTQDLSVTYVTTAASSGAAITITTTGRILAGEAYGHTDTNRTVVSVTNGTAGGKVRVYSNNMRADSPALAVAVIDQDGVVETSTGLIIGDTGTAGIDFRTSSADTTAAGTLDRANSAQQDGNYGIISNASTTWDAAVTNNATSGNTTSLRVRYGATTATSAFTVVTSASATIAASSVSVTGTGVKNHSDSANTLLMDNGNRWTVPVATKSVVMKVRAMSSATAAVANYPLLFTVTWNSSAAAGEVTPRTTSTTVAATSVTTDSSGYASLTLTNNSPIDGAQVTVNVSGFTGTAAGQVILWQKNKAAVVSVSGGSPMKAATKSTNTISFTYTDTFGVPVVGATVDLSISGAGQSSTAPVVIPSTTTDANGVASYTWTDAAGVEASTTLGTTTITATARDTALAGSRTVTWVATMPVVATLTGFRNDNEATSAPATYPDPVDAGAVIYDTASAGTKYLIDTTSNLTRSNLLGGDNKDQVAFEYTAKDAAGALVSGVPVVVTASEGAWILNSATGLPVTSRTLYTSTGGLVSFIVKATKTGTHTITLTNGTVSTTTKLIYGNASTDARYLALSANASGTANAEKLPSITATVTDRYGNAVSGVTITVVHTGVGRLAGGAKTTSYTTDSAGQYVIEGTSTEAGTASVKVTASASSSQLEDIAGYVGTTELVDAITAGSSEVTGTFTFAAGTSAATAAAEAATDAAAEAIDAANAATDAANLAAEAADAATVAAEEARDAADAATAAVEELATQVATLMAALKAQITTLANTVAKIAKKVRA